MGRGAVGSKWECCLEQERGRAGGLGGRRPEWKDEREEGGTNLENELLPLSLLLTSSASFPRVLKAKGRKPVGSIVTAMMETSVLSNNNCYTVCVNEVIVQKGQDTMCLVLYPFGVPPLPLPPMAQLQFLQIPWLHMYQWLKFASNVSCSLHIETLLLFIKKLNPKSKTFLH